MDPKMDGDEAWWGSMGALFWRGSMRISMKIRRAAGAGSALGRRCLFTLDVQLGTQWKSQELLALVASLAEKIAPSATRGPTRSPTRPDTGGRSATLSGVRAALNHRAGCVKTPGRLQPKNQPLERLPLGACPAQQVGSRPTRRRRFPAPTLGLPYRQRRRADNPKTGADALALT